MYRKSIQTKDKIIRAMIELIDTKNTGEITLRDVAKATGIGIGLVNYHFGTKENLIDIAVDTFISETTSNGEASLDAFQLAPVDKLKISIKGYADFLTVHPKISRLSIMKAMMNESSDKASEHGIKYYIPILKEIFRDKDEKDLCIILHQLVSTIQMTFLRSGEMKDLIDIDFFNEVQRESLVEKLVNNLINGSSPQPACGKEDEKQ